MRTLAIIGTAGRGDDAAKLGPREWHAMLRAAGDVMAILWRTDRALRLVSGGAAWADHVAITMGLDSRGQVPLALHLPGRADDIETAARYHLRFSHALGINSKAIIESVSGCAWVTITRGGSFKDRNGRVAHAADSFLAMTFGKEGRTKDGGTAHTVRLMQAQGKAGWHFDLNRLELFEAERI